MNSNEVNILKTKHFIDWTWHQKSIFYHQCSWILRTIILIKKVYITLWRRSNISGTNYARVVCNGKYVNTVLWKYIMFPIKAFYCIWTRKINIVKRCLLKNLFMIILKRDSLDHHYLDDNISFQLNIVQNVQCETRNVTLMSLLD